MGTHETSRPTDGTVGTARNFFSGKLSGSEHNPDLFTAQYPDAPGYRTAGPSEEAAAAMRGRCVTIRRMILDLLRQHPAGLTTDEALAHLELSRPTGQPRFSELRRMGEIVATDERRRNASGMTATVWKIADPLPNREGGQP